MRNQMHRHRTHHRRVYVIDKGEKPVGCATCTDVLRAVLAASGSDGA